MGMGFNDLLRDFLSDEIIVHTDQAILLEKPVYHSKSKTLNLKTVFDHPLPFPIYQKLLHDLRIALHAAIDLSIQANEKMDDINEIDRYISWITSKRKSVACFQGLHPSFSHELDLKFSSTSEDRIAKLKHAAPELKEELDKAGIHVEILVELTEETPDAGTASITLPKAAEKTGNPSVNDNRPRYRNNKKEAIQASIGELQVGMENVALTGHIFDQEMRTFRTGKSLQTIYLSDYENAVACKRFENRFCSKEDLESIKTGMFVRVTGNMVYDNYARDNVLMISSIEQIPAPVRKDENPEKRIEWHVHTTFSEMDGVCSVEEYIQQAYDWGMEAIAVTDHNVVQAFPLAQHKVEALKKKNPDRPFKVLYGCEMSMVNMDYNPVYNPAELPIEDTEFVVFDLETTGLSNRLDDIIEFGAVRMKNKEVLERKQFFINPKRPIPAHISALTHIHQSDVENAKPLEEAFEDIRAFCKDAILVAHNASFDFGMLNAAARKLGQPEFDNPVIDTLHMAYSMLNLKGYRLGNLCRHYGVAYDGEGAHRADYDAEVLCAAFTHMLNDLGPELQLADILKLGKAKDLRDALRKNRAHHINVYAKNKEGLKELFELVTLSHTKCLAYNPNGGSNVTGVPRIPKEELQKAHDRGNLLFSSACQNGEIFELAHTRSEKDLKKAMQFYDMIEVQPLACYKNLLDRHAVASKSDLQKILRFIIDAAKDLNIPVIASSDAHYVHPHEKRARDVYINAKAGGNSRHPLYKFSLADRQSMSNPDQHFLTTDEMLKAFDWLADDKLIYEIVIDNPKKMAAAMDVLYPVKDRLYPPDIEGSDQKLRDICYETARNKYGEPLPAPVKERLDRELDAIIGAGYYVVYYISHLLVKKSNEDGYLVGSRGSVGSSFVATMSGITEVNPLKPHYICEKCHHLEWIDDENIHSGFDLPDKVCPDCGEIMRGDGQDIPFETFLGFEGDKVPDIDLNFSGEYQPNAHAFTKTIFGDDHVFRAGTVGTVQDKTAYGFVLGYEEELELNPFSEAKRNDLAKACEGVKRTTGQHPGGIVVVPLDMDVHDFTPVQFPANNPYAEWKTTHFDFHQIHDNILKFDILGHVDPTAMKMLERMSGIDVTTIPMNDPETISIFSSTDALKVDSTQYRESTGAAGIPEFGTPFVRGILELTRPTTFAELVSISGLSHGTNVWLTNAKDLIDAGICTLRQVIGCRDDIMVDLIRYGLPSKASFTIMESVRKGKGLNDDWEKLMKENQVPDWYIDSCKKIKYMFPKAHAVAYVIMAVRIAWFKVHKPLIYYCQFFSIRCNAYDIPTMVQGRDAIEKRMFAIEQARQDKTTKVSDKENEIYDTLVLAYEMVMRGYRFSNLSISRSAATEFRVDPDDDKAIIPPFCAVDSLGENVAKSIVAAREQKPFLSKEDVLNRTQLSRTLLEKLDFMGALEGLDDENQLTLF
ncbi:PolC-type DNA polymerase III [Ileibacterium valens]|uniref:DNA polymerase III PolC-type n=2 Tax=Ileibacterium valens TaxID=1862668 RepID=A0A1U7ND25_9FIRM|nr:PolC-type DNA polymerase III [Ileibacterium valens]OLU36713.1 PolC-type DNA polymerase III [Ileibacterium valens]OLU39029.1 PolC-type DNA polymerase III [Erysipelotrichaceae bacterium NYU-BL-F16]OLU41206.1 PolC-type DNA polymerase III [Erysipelotrichaceae bacterium NYU-BL-E8]